MPRSAPKKNLSKSLGLALAIAVVGLGALLYSHRNNPTSNSKGSASRAVDTSPSSKSGAVTDNSGNIATDTPASDWTAAKSGNIVLHSPSSNAVLQNGDVISGTAKVGLVQYRLIDDSAGVIAQGSISVVSGKFSGSIYFSHQAKSGSLEIYSTDTAGGPQQNNIKVGVKF